MYVVYGCRGNLQMTLYLKLPVGDKPGGQGHELRNGVLVAVARPSARTTFFINARRLTNSVERFDWLCSWLCWLSDTNQRDRKIQNIVLTTRRYGKTRIV